MMYAASFLISAIAFSLLARGETEAWARDDARDEKRAGELDSAKELMEINTAGVVPKNPIV